MASVKMEAECSGMETFSQRGGSVAMAAKRAWRCCEKVLPRWGRITARLPWVSATASRDSHSWRAVSMLVSEMFGAWL